MIELRKARDRGHRDHGWLDTWHSFSFADYHDPERMGVSHLRVINDDRIAPGVGFPTHPHRDMEIITYVLEGSLAHHDSMGNGTVIRAGEVQRMSAGSGITHSEHNASEGETVHLLQIWIHPNRRDLSPSYEQHALVDAELRGRLRLIAAPDGRDGAVTIHQDACLWAGRFGSDDSAVQPVAEGRIAYVHLARGTLVVNGTRLEAGDAVIVEGEPVVMKGSGDGEVLLFDLAEERAD